MPPSGLAQFLCIDRFVAHIIGSVATKISTFNINFPEKPIFGKPSPTKAVSVGYKVILEQLTPGKHDIHFKASLTNPTTSIPFYNDDVKYTLNVK